jgi:hypothetical protein
MNFQYQNKSENLDNSLLRRFNSDFIHSSCINLTLILFVI